MRMLASFPEVGAIKVMQGKESVALDLSTAEGRTIVCELARRSDVVIQSFRAGVAERLGVDSASLMALNPDLVYLNSPGYGVDGPCGHRPAYAPTIAAATGVAWRMAGVTFPQEPVSLSIEEIKETTGRMVSASNAAFAQCDGLSALGVATAAPWALWLVSGEPGVRNCLPACSLLGPMPIVRMWWPSPTDLRRLKLMISCSGSARCTACTRPRRGGCFWRLPRPRSGTC